MMDKKTAHTEAELTTIFVQNNIDVKYHPQFIAYYKHCFSELYGDMKNWNDDDFAEGDSIQASALSLTNEYIERYLEIIAKGHGEEWAHHVARSVERSEKASYHAYSEIERNNPELAKKELLIHCKSLNGDVYFDKRYLYLFEICDFPEGRIQKSKAYSKIIKEQLALGKSEIHAHEYAALVASGRGK